MNYIQTGYNPKYPKSVTIWIPDTEMDKVPEWIINICRVKNVETFDGKIILDYIRNTSGGYEFKNSYDNGSYVNTKYKDDILCYGENRIFSLRPEQFELLYKVWEK